MRLNVKYFGMIVEWSQEDKSQIEVEGSSVDELRSALVQAIPQLKTITYQIAVNQKLVTTDIDLSEDDEIAILPPFAGG